MPAGAKRSGGQSDAWALPIGNEFLPRYLERASTVARGIRAVGATTSKRGEVRAVEPFKPIVDDARSASGADQSSIRRNARKCLASPSTTARSTASAWVKDRSSAGRIA